MQLADECLTQHTVICYQTDILVSHQCQLADIQKFLYIHWVVCASGFNTALKFSPPGLFAPKAHVKSNAQFHSKSV